MAAVDRCTVDISRGRVENYSTGFVETLLNPCSMSPSFPADGNYTQGAGCSSMESSLFRHCIVLFNASCVYRRY